MAGGQIQVTLDTRALERVMLGYERQARALPLNILGQEIATRVDDLIQSEGDGQWPPLSPATILRHPRRAGGTLLQDTGLLASMQVLTGPDWVLVKSPAPYADYHVTGTRKMPKRNFLEIDMNEALEVGADLIAAELVNL